MSSTSVPRDHYYVNICSIQKSRITPGDSKGGPPYYQTPGQDGRTVLPPFSADFPNFPFPGLAYSSATFTQPRWSPGRFHISAQALDSNPQWTGNSPRLEQSFSPNYDMMSSGRYSPAPSHSYGYSTRGSSPPSMIPQDLASVRLLIKQIDDANSSEGANLEERDLSSMILQIVTTKDLYRDMLRTKGSEAQTILDALQQTIDLDAFEQSAEKRGILKALERLSQSSGLYPRRLTLQHIYGLSPQPVGSGSAGEVFRARCKGREIALKVFRVCDRTDRSKLAKAIWKEAILWSQLRHPNLLPFYGVHHLAALNHRIALVSPWLKNGDVNQYLKANPQANRLLLVSDVASGVAYLHENKIVHGDLKGANILTSASGRACLADFGLSRISDSALLRWTSVQTNATNSGTLRWKAPEMFAMNEDEDVEGSQSGISMEADVYAFACVSYEIVTGRMPFDEIKRSREHLIIQKVLNGRRPKKPSHEDIAFRRYGLTEPIWSFIASCWEQEPGNRPTALAITHHPLLNRLMDPRPTHRQEQISGADFRRLFA